MNIKAFVLRYCKIYQRKDPLIDFWWKGGMFLKYCPRSMYQNRPTNISKLIIGFYNSTEYQLRSKRKSFIPLINFITKSISYMLRNFIIKALLELNLHTCTVNIFTYLVCVNIKCEVRQGISKL